MHDLKRFAFAIACSFGVLTAGGCEVSRLPELGRDGGDDHSGQAGIAILPMGGGVGGFAGMTAGTSGISGGMAGFGGPNLCAMNHGGCSPLVTCTVVDGEAQCGECPEHTTDVNGDGTQCPDTDECATGENECDTDPPAICTNQPFTYLCQCPTGFHDSSTSGRNCEPDNPMMPMGGAGGMTGGASGAGGMSGGASGASGSSGSSGASGTNGGPVNECMAETDECDTDPVATCTDTPTSYTCACPAGYEDLTTGGRTCGDIDECTRNTDQCDTSPAALCHDNDGSYTCECPAGFQDLTTGGRNCVQINECTLGTDTCDNDPDACVDGLASYTCECPAGFTDVNGNGSDCSDQNECTANTDICDDNPIATCLNDNGSYTCTCPADTIDVLGDGSACTTPEKLVALGTGHTCAILQGGTVKCWGQSFYGELGLGIRVSRGNVAGQTGDGLVATNLGGRVVQLAGGCNHTCALMENGDVKCWGRNQFGQLGQGDTDNRGEGRRPCVAGSSASCVCDVPGCLDPTEPIPAGMTEMGDYLDPIPLGTAAVSVTAGCEYSCALLAGGGVKCWGGNDFGQVAIGTILPVGDSPGEVEALNTIPLGGPVKLLRGGFRYACAQFEDNSMKCWGRNQNGQLGQNNQNHRGDQPGEIDSLSAINFGAGRTTKTFAAGYTHNCTILDNDTVKCWGGELNGGFGYGDTLVNRGDGLVQASESDGMGNEMGDTLATILLNGTPVALAAQNHTCVLFSDQTIACFGPNGQGQLGLGDLDARGDAPGEMGASLGRVSLGGSGHALAVFTGTDEDSARAHTCALLDSGGLKCWGDNSRGQLGLGDTNDRGDVLDEMGDALRVSMQLW